MDHPTQRIKQTTPQGHRQEEREWGKPAPGRKCRRTRDTSRRRGAGGLSEIGGDIPGQRLGQRPIQTCAGTERGTRRDSSHHHRGRVEASKQRLDRQIQRARLSWMCVTSTSFAPQLRQRLASSFASMRSSHCLKIFSRRLISSSLLHRRATPPRLRHKPMQADNALPAPRLVGLRLSHQHPTGDTHDRRPIRTSARQHHCATSRRADHPQTLLSERTTGCGCESGAGTLARCRCIQADKQRSVCRISEHSGCIAPRDTWSGGIAPGPAPASTPFVHRLIEEVQENWGGGSDSKSASSSVLVARDSPQNSVGLSPCVIASSDAIKCTRDRHNNPGSGVCPMKTSTQKHAVSGRLITSFVGRPSNCTRGGSHSGFRGTNSIAAQGSPGKRSCSSGFLIHLRWSSEILNGLSACVITCRAAISCSRESKRCNRPSCSPTYGCTQARPDGSSSITSFVGWTSNSGSGGAVISGGPRSRPAANHRPRRVGACRFNQYLPCAFPLDPHRETFSSLAMAGRQQVQVSLSAVAPFGEHSAVRFRNPVPKFSEVHGPTVVTTKASVNSGYSFSFP